jgi:hypothetical protein
VDRINRQTLEIKDTMPNNTWENGGFSAKFNENLRNKFSKASTAFIIVFSIILIARGIYFEYQNYQQKTVIECHP